MTLLEFAGESRRHELAIDDSSHDHGEIQCDPADTWQIDILVLFLYSEPEPQEGGK